MKSRRPLLRSTLLAASVLATLGASRLAAAQSCTFPSPAPDQGDSFYMSGWKCGQSYINDMWSRFSMSSSSWSSFGYSDPCNTNKPLARTFDALMALGYSHTSTPSCTMSGNVLDWAYCWAGDQIDELEAACGTDPNVRAHTEFGLFVDNYTEVYMPFFYGETVVARASTVFHEARHASWCGHNGDANCPRKKSCDDSFNNGCTYGSGQGADAFQVRFLEWFATTATWTTDAMKKNAIDEANGTLMSAFVHDPCFRLNDSGYEVRMC